MNLPIYIRFRIIIIIYYLYLIIGLLPFFQILNYGYIINIFFIVVSILMFPLKQTFKDIIFILVCFLLILLSTNTKIIYMINDLIIIAIVLHLINIHKKNPSNDFSLIKNISLIYILLTLLAVFNKDYFYIGNDGVSRFVGLMESTNVSLFIDIFLMVLIWEIQKLYRYKPLILIIIVILYTYFCYLSRSRSVLFAIPYFINEIIQLKTVRISKKNITFVLSIIVISILLNLENIKFIFRFDIEESSYITRSNMYSTLFDRIKSDYYIIPHGFNAANDIETTLSYGVNKTAHNDFLRYLYDWGVFFVVIIVIIIYKLKTHISLKNITIYIIFISAALNNMLLSIYIIVPFTLILLTDNYSKRISINKQINK